MVYPGFRIQNRYIDFLEDPEQLFLFTRGSRTVILIYSRIQNRNFDLLEDPEPLFDLLEDPEP